MGLGRPAKILVSAIIIYLIIWFGGWLYPLLPLGCIYDCYVEIFGGILVSDWFVVGLLILILIAGIGGSVVYYTSKDKKKLDIVKKIKPLHLYIAIVAVPALIIFVLVLGLLSGVGRTWSCDVNNLSYFVLIYPIVALIIGSLVYWCLKD